MRQRSKGLGKRSNSTTSEDLWGCGKDSNSAALRSSVLRLECPWDLIAWTTVGSPSRLFPKPAIFEKSNLRRSKTQWRQSWMNRLNEMYNDIYRFKKYFLPRTLWEKRWTELSWITLRWLARSVSGGPLMGLLHCVWNAQIWKDRNRKKRIPDVYSSEVNSAGSCRCSKSTFWNAT